MRGWPILSYGPGIMADGESRGGCLMAVSGPTGPRRPIHRFLCWAAPWRTGGCWCGRSGVGMATEDYSPWRPRGGAVGGAVVGADAGRVGGYAAQGWVAAARMPCWRVERDRCRSIGATRRRLVCHRGRGVARRRHRCWFGVDRVRVVPGVCGDSRRSGQGLLAGRGLIGRFLRPQDTL